MKSLLLRFNPALLTPLVMLFATIGILQAADDPVDQFNLGKDRVAIQGYDPVGYFTEGRALKGSPQFTAAHQGVTYQFASDANRKLFTASPEKYLPTYGGWCATAMAKAEKVKIDPNNFKVTNGRLFLFYKGLFGDAKKDWLKDESGLSTKADVSWKKIAGQ